MKPSALGKIPLGEKRKIRLNSQKRGTQIFDVGDS